MQNGKEQRVLLAFVLVLLAAGGLSAWLWLSGEKRGGTAATAPEREVAEAPAPEEIDPADTPEIESAEPRAAIAPSEATRRDVAVLARGWDASESRWLEGSVHMPPGVPANERAQVLALSRPLGQRGIHGEDGPVAWLQAAELGKPEKEQHEHLLSLAEVLPDGTFRIEVPRSARFVHLAVAGRYLYSHASHPVDCADEAHPVELSPALGAWFTGRLHAPESAGSESLAGLEVHLEHDFARSGFDPMQAGPSALDREVTTDSEGRFDLRAVPPSKALVLTAVPENLAVHVERDMEARAGAHVELLIELKRGATIFGRTIDDEGKPVAGAEVRVRAPGLEGAIAGELREVESGGDGSFALHGVAVLDRVVIEAKKKGYLDGSLEIAGELKEGGALTEREVSLDRGFAIEGSVVLASGDPAPDAKLLVAGDWSAGGGMGGPGGRMGSSEDGAWGPETSTRADAEGRFRVSGLSAGTFVVTATWDEADSSGTWTAREPGVKSGEAPIEIVLSEPVRLLGNVVDVEGLPLSDFHVTATRKGSGGMFGLGLEVLSKGFDDADGVFELSGLRADTWTVVVDAFGFAQSEPLEIAVPTAQTTDFILLPACSVSGFVRDPEGNPVPDARIGLVLEMAELMRTQRGGRKTAFSRRDGAFELTDLDPGSIQVYAELDGFASSASEALKLAPGERIAGIELRLRVGGLLTGQVFGPDGKPAPDRMVYGQAMPTFHRQVMEHTNADGTFRFEHLDPGQWQIVVLPGDMIGGAAGGQSDREEGDLSDMFRQMEIEVIDIADGEERHLVLGAPPEDPVTVRGRVLDATGPVGGALVSFLPEGASGFSGAGWCTSNDDGAFEIELDEAGSYLVTVQTGMAEGRQHSVEQVEQIPKGQHEYELDVRLPGGSISGTVRDAAGELLSGARVTVTVEGGFTVGTIMGGNYSETSTDVEGRYTVSHLRAGDYQVCAGGSYMGGMFGGEALGGRSAIGGVRVAEGRARDGVDFRLEAPCKLEVLARDADGRPVPGAALFVRDSEGRPLERFSINTTGPDGRRIFTGLAPGRYTVSARTGDLASAESAAVRVRADETVAAEVTLVSGTLLRIEVVEKSDEPVRARIRVTDAQGREVSGLLALEDITRGNSDFRPGVQTVGPLPPGDYKVSAIAFDGSDASKPVSLSGQPERSVKLRLK